MQEDRKSSGFQAGEFSQGHHMTLVVCLSYLICESRSPDVLLVEDAAYGLVTEPLAGLAAGPFHIKTMGAIEERAHSVCNLLNVSHIHEQSLTFAD